ncbi:MAG: helix-turn-helix domain-containing protein [Nitrosospira sp.]|nr:helix-turn-helix domain-containing protein [Nitrosospira sp.]
MNAKVVKIGIASEEELRQRTLDIAAGRRRRARGEPKIWFTSLRSAAEVLSEKNRDLLRILAEQQPASVKELAELANREPGNLSRTLKTLAGYGLVEIEREGRRMRPVARATRFQIYAH